MYHETSEPFCFQQHLLLSTALQCDCEYRAYAATRLGSPQKPFAVGQVEVWVQGLRSSTELNNLEAAGVGFWA